jgi:hypothetical protein
VGAVACNVQRQRHSLLPRLHAVLGLLPTGVDLQGLGTGMGLGLEANTTEVACGGHKTLERKGCAPRCNARGLQVSEYKSLSDLTVSPTFFCFDTICFGALQQNIFQISNE